MVNPWMQTYSGVPFDLLEPQEWAVRLRDISHSLSLTNRFNGHTRRPWSVAEHSLFCLELMGDDYGARMRLLVLIHDFIESYVSDLSTPMKRTLDAVSTSALDAFNRIESRINTAIHAKLLLEPPTYEEKRVIKHFDLLALRLEAEVLMGPPPLPWIEMPEPDERQQRIAKRVFGWRHRLRSPKRTAAQLERKVHELGRAAHEEIVNGMVDVLDRHQEDEVRVAA